VLKWALVADRGRGGGDVTLALSLLEVAFRVATMFLFPALAVWAWRVSGPARLWLATGLGLCLVLLFAAFVASAMGGNVLAPVHGYRYTAPRSLVLHALTVGLPLVATAVAVQTLAGRLSSRLWLYMIGVLCAGLAWVIGVIAAIQILVAIA
jgi:hypothetical protein